MTVRTGKWLSAVCAGVTAALAVAGCSSTGGSGSGTTANTTVLTMPGPAGPLETPTITIEAVPTVDVAGLYIANDLGYFKQEGLTVHIVSMSGTPLELADVVHGKTDLVAGNYLPFVLAQYKHEYDFRIIAAGSQMQPGSQALYVMPGSKYKTVASLAAAHAKIGVNTLNNLGSLLIGSQLVDNGYKLSDVQLVTPPATAASPFAVNMSYLARGQVQAAWLPEPFATIAEESFGAEKIDDFDSGSLQNFPLGAYIGAASWVRSHPNTVAAFLRALQKGQATADTDRAQVESSLVGNILVPNGIKPGAARQLAALMTPTSYPLTMSVPEIQRISNSMFEFGMEPGLSSPYNMINMIQPEPGMNR